MNYSVKAKEIPEVQKEYTDIWELVKQFYHVQPDSDEDYWESVVRAIKQFTTIHPTPNAAGLAIQFINELARRKEEKYGCS